MLNLLLLLLTVLSVALAFVAGAVFWEWVDRQVTIPAWVPRRLLVWIPRIAALIVER